MHDLKDIPLWRQPRVRGLFVQILLIVLVCWVIGTGVQNTIDNMTKRGLASGFGFLSDPAGFDIIFSMIPWSEDHSNGRAFLVALLNTLLVSFLGIVLATAIGFMVGIARLSSNWLASTLASIWVESIRNVPLLLQLFIWYFGVIQNLGGTRQSMAFYDVVFLNVRGLYFPWPKSPHEMLIFLVSFSFLFLGMRYFTIRHSRSKRFFWITLLLFTCCLWFLSGATLAFDIPTIRGFNFQGGAVLVPELVALLLGLATYTSAFVAEIVRAGFLSVNRGQFEAAASLGLNRAQTLKFVIIPQALRVIIPPLTSQYLNLTKNSSLGSAIAYPEIVLIFAGTVLTQTGMAVEIVAMTMGVYLVISLLIAAVMNKYNSWIMGHGGG